MGTLIARQSSKTNGAVTKLVDCWIQSVWDHTWSQAPEVRWLYVLGYRWTYGLNDVKAGAYECLTQRLFHVQLHCWHWNSIKQRSTLSGSQLYSWITIPKQVIYLHGGLSSPGCQPVILIQCWHPCGMRCWSSLVSQLSLKNCCFSK